MNAQRVIITPVSPLVQNGEYIAKAVVHDQVVIAADIFCDGHDELAASVLIKHRSDRQWKELPLELTGNDRWELPVILEKEGLYRFRFIAWTDHFTTWKKGLKKKADAGQDITIEKQIGQNLLEQAMLNATVKDKLLLKEWKERIGDGSFEPDLLFEGEELDLLMRKNRDQSKESRHERTFSIEAERERAGFSTWYELFPRSASTEPGKHGTFADVKKLLPRIAQAGFDVLYFPPVHPIGFDKRKGKNNSLQAGEHDPGSPWAVGSAAGGHKAIHPELGTLKDFRDLVKKAASHGLEVAMDIAFQCAPDHPYVKEHPQWFKWRPDGTVQYAENPPKKYEDILPFDFETSDWENLWSELKSIFEFWIDKGVRIFRVDNPHTKPLRFWEWCIAEIRSKHPEIIFLAEAFTRPRIMERLAMAGFNQSYTYFTWRHTKQEITEYMNELTETDKRYYFRPNFWPNTPDILTPELAQGGENMHVIRLLLAATLSSSYGVYGPVYEHVFTAAMPGKEEYIDNEKYEIRHWPWHQYTRMRELMARVNRIRKENTALQKTWNITFAETSDDHIICYVKADLQNNNILIVVVNLDPHHTHEATVKLPMPAMGMRYEQQFRVHDLLSGDRYIWGEYNFVRLDPHVMPAHIFLIQPDHFNQ